MRSVANLFKLLWLSILFSLLLACQPGEIASDDYFPLNKGLRWSYQVSQSGKLKEFSVESRGKVHLNGKYEDDAVYVRRTSDGTDYYILKDDIGSFRVAQRSIVETKPRLDQEMRKIIPSSKDLGIGSHWTNESNTFTFRSTPQFSVDDSVGRHLSMYYEVVSIDDTVTVPAGKFVNCIKVVGTAQFSFYADARSGYIDVPITHTEWYAPGVGLIKLVRDETLEHELFTGEQVEFALTEFKH